MRRKHAVWMVLVIFLLAAGWFLFQLFNPSPVALDENPFRAWLWQHRSLDLLIQVVIFFAGTAGIAALLPRDHHDH